MLQWLSLASVDKHTQPGESLPRTSVTVCQMPSLWCWGQTEEGRQLWAEPGPSVSDLQSLPASVSFYKMEPTTPASAFDETGVVKPRPCRAHGRPSRKQDPKEQATSSPFLEIFLLSVPPDPHQSQFLLAPDATSNCHSGAEWTFQTLWFPSVVLTRLMSCRKRLPCGLSILAKVRNCVLLLPVTPHGLGTVPGYARGQQT